MNKFLFTKYVIKKLVHFFNTFSFGFLLLFIYGDPSVPVEKRLKFFDFQRTVHSMSV